MNAVKGDHHHELVAHQTGTSGIVSTCASTSSVPASFGISADS
jgi:hypothetical protein